MISEQKPHMHGWPLTSLRRPADTILCLKHRQSPTVVRCRCGGFCAADSRRVKHDKNSTSKPTNSRQLPA